MEPQQSKPYACYIQQLGWHVVTVKHVNIFLKQIPFLGGLAKIHRPQQLPALSKLIPVLKKHSIKTIACEPDSLQDPHAFHAWIQELSKHFKIHSSPFLPTKTIRIDVTKSEEKIFQQFSEAKRRGVRRALKHGVTVQESTTIDDLIAIKNKSAGLFGFITTHGIKHMWNIFAPKHAAILLAYHPHHPSLITHNLELVGGVLLIFWDSVAYYWIAGATRQGKKLFAPTLLAWEAIKLSKQKGCNQFDFVGVWDERKPNQYIEWKGFTKFKEGFGGKELYYPIATLHK